ncbi:hypothetical protein [Bacillus sp. JCM 19034]|uniref:hypothetical protein n=1 Tax=Bacillus sp. JCM 19034 TaxID=1481928 RepID=UPI000784F1F7|nr:hypothetical protein [Bacillus sp. JCM 19034]
MEQLMNTLKQNDGRERIPVLRLELDYELVTLHDAMVNEDLVAINNAKNRLRQLRAELIEYGVFR